MPSRADRAVALRVEGLCIEVRTPEGWQPAVQDVSFSITAGETLALVGESGCGKSLTALSVMRLVSNSGVRVSAGEIRLRQDEISRLPEAELSRLRGNQMAMVFQEPMTSLNPLMTVGRQIAEPLRIHRGLSRAAARQRAFALLEEVGIPSARERLDAYPHELSGGMRQRVMIAIAIACEPAVLLADEPTTALDVTIQAQILALLKGLQQRHGTAMLFITHNMGVVAQVADRIAVMYAGEIVEEGSVLAIFDHPRHPYTRALFGVIPRLDFVGQQLAAIPGRVPALGGWPTGCRFRPRCSLAQSGCERPQALERVQDGHSVRCHVAASAGVEAPRRAPPTMSASPDSRQWPTPTGRRPVADMARLRRLAETDRPTVGLEIDGVKVAALTGDTLQVAILTHTGALRDNEFGDGRRAGFCLMAACQDCWVWTAEGERLRACSTEVAAGMRILTTGAPWPLEQS